MYINIKAFYHIKKSGNEWKDRINFKKQDKKY